MGQNSQANSQANSRANSRANAWDRSSGPSGVLDSYTGATAAYSTVLLYSTHTTDVVNVRRSGDNAELGFTAAEIADGTLAAWVVAGGGTQHGYVVDWYDQSGNGNTASQATAGNQPQIVASGSVVTESGKPAVDFDGSDDYMVADVTDFQSISNLSTFTVLTPDAAAAADTNTIFAWMFGDFTPSPRTLGVGSSTGALSGELITIYFDDATSRRLGSSTYSRGVAAQELLSSLHLSTGTSVYQNGAAVTLGLASNMTTGTAAAPSNTGYSTNNNVYINASFTASATAGPSAKWQVLTFYNSDQSANRSGIESALNAEFSVY